MKSHFPFLLAFFLSSSLLFFSSCRKSSNSNDEPPVVDITLLSPADQSIINILDALEIQWKVTQEEGISAVIRYGTSEENLDQILVVPDANAQKQTLENIEPFQTYFFKIEIKHDEEVLVTSETLSFSTTLGYTVTLTTPEKDKEFFPDADIPFVWENTLATHEKYGAKFSYELHLSEDGKTYAAAEKDLLTEKHTLKNPFSAVGEHFWRIRTSFDNDTDTLFSEKGVFKTRNSPPSEPELKKPIDGNTVKAGNIVFEWTASEDGNKGDSITYALLIQEEGGTEETIATEISNTSYTHGDPLKDGKTFSWKIVATDPHGETAESDPASFQTFENKVPSKPVLPTTNSEGDTIDVPEKLTWGASDDDDGDAVSYIIFIDEVAVDTVETVEYTPEGLLGGRTYTWRVEAIDGNGGKASSEESSFTTANRKPTKPVLTAPITNGIDIALKPLFEWNSSTDPDDQDVTYDLVLSENENLSNPIFSETSLLDTSFQLENLKLSAGEKTYYWQVVSKDQLGLTNQGEVHSFTTIPRYSITSIDHNLDAIAEDFAGRADITTAGIDSAHIFRGAEGGIVFSFDVETAPLNGEVEIDSVAFNGSESTTNNAEVDSQNGILTCKSIGKYEVFFRVKESATGGESERKSYIFYVTSNVPDDFFRKDLEEYYPDNNIIDAASGYLNTSTAKMISNMIRTFSHNCSPYISLLGIEYFTGLDTLMLGNLYALLNLDLSELTELTYLFISDAEFQVLDLSELTKLTYLTIYGGPLQVLDLSELTELTYLSISSRHLQVLDLPNLVKLKYLSIDYDFFTLDVSNLTQLEYLHISSENISNLDVSNLPELKTFSVINNPKLETLNISNLTTVTELYVGSNPLLKILDISSLLSVLQELTIDEDIICNHSSIKTFAEGGGLVFSGSGTNITYEARTCP